MNYHEHMDHHLKTLSIYIIIDVEQKQLCGI